MEKPYIIQFSKIGEKEIGHLSVAEFGDNIPFDIKRTYWVYGTPENIERGNHAHIEGVQILIPVHGVVRVTLESKEGTLMEYELNDPSMGLYIPKMYWRKLKFQKEGVCLCLASTVYTEEDYIYDYSIFKK